MIIIHAITLNGTGSYKIQSLATKLYILSNMCINNFCANKSTSLVSAGQEPVNNSSLLRY